MSTQPMPLLDIEVVFACQTSYRCIALQVGKGTTIMDAIRQSGILVHYPEISLQDAYKVGIYNKIKTLDTLVNEGDRVEIYQPLHQDPMSARAQRLKKTKA